MSLFIEVYVGSRDNRILVADCHAYNTSDLAKISDYKFRSYQKGAAHLDIPSKVSEGEILRHNRNQSVWALVEKIAEGSK